MKDEKPDLKTIIASARAKAQSASKYAFLAFLVMVIGIYGFLMFRINTLKNTEPSANEVSSQVKAARVPRIDKNVIKQLESLKDNSVSVKSLFNDARNNPFQ